MIMVLATPFLSPSEERADAARAAEEAKDEDGDAEMGEAEEAAVV